MKIRFVVLGLLSALCVTASQVGSAEATFSGHAHWYGKELHGRRTASGAVFDKDKLTAAHPSLKFGTRVRVKSLLTSKDVVVEINDRCPKNGQRVIDLSEAAAKQIGIWPGKRNDVQCFVLQPGQTDFKPAPQTDRKPTPESTESDRKPTPASDAESR